MMPKALAGQALIDTFANQILTLLPDGTKLTRSTGYIPMLVAYTHEDREARGLRKLVDPNLPRPPVYFTALEATAMDRALLLTGQHGAGKTSFALDLALRLAGEAVGNPMLNAAGLDRPVPRNDLGAVERESWSAPPSTRLPAPLYLAAEPALDQAGLTALVANHLDNAPLLLIIDNAERLGAGGAALVRALGAMLDADPTLRVLLLGEAEVCRNWPLPQIFASYALLPLLAAQKRLFLEAHSISVADYSEGPSLAQGFTMALAQAAPGASVETLVEAEAGISGWHDAVAPGGPSTRAFVAWRDDRARATPQGSALSALVLTAEHLAGQPTETILALFKSDVDRWTLPIRWMATHPADLRPLVAGLAKAGARGAVLAADLLAANGGDDAHESWNEVVPALIEGIAGGRLPVSLRDLAGRHLGRQGDHRDLEEMITVPPGRYVMGSRTHPNSTPVHQNSLAAFRIGRFPVTNRLYRQFIADTGRAWRTADGHEPERANAPAVDMSWHDARACCMWLTGRWRRDGRIATEEQVRLPTEPEWEAAARSGQPDGGDAIIYPWAGPWSDARANSAETGFNDTCAVGLFPAGRSAAGADDMTGLVWEWTTTLWGRDPATPDLPYPYYARGREDPDAPFDVRRVLRGGCFSSNRFKACCTYRGSLEPDGYWRGNGFRVVVARR